jgi:pimeloyl-ACP methyl ester carboxylesterase
MARDNRGMEIVFVHGAGGGAWEWAIWQRVFAAHGFASSAIELVAAPRGLAGTTFDDYAAQVRAFARDRTDVALVGASLGGLLALAVSEAVAPRARVLVNPMPPSPWHASLPGEPPSGDVVPWRASASLAGTRRAMPDADDAACRFAWRRWRDESAAVLRAAREGIAAPALRAPTLVIASGCDDDVPSDASAALAASLPAELVRIDGASHVGPLLGRAAAACARIAAQWLNRVSELHERRADSA